jgi:hypothetical protein
MAQKCLKQGSQVLTQPIHVRVTKAIATNRQQVKIQSQSNYSLTSLAVPANPKAPRILSSASLSPSGISSRARPPPAGHPNPLMQAPTLQMHLGRAGQWRGESRSERRSKRPHEVEFQHKVCRDGPCFKSGSGNWLASLGQARHIWHRVADLWRGRIGRVLFALCVFPSSRIFVHLPRTPVAISVFVCEAMTGEFH